LSLHDALPISQQVSYGVVVFDVGQAAYEARAGFVLRWRHGWVDGTGIVPAGTTRAAADSTTASISSDRRRGDNTGCRVGVNARCDANSRSSSPWYYATGSIGADGQ